MSESDFQAPELETMNALLPAFEFGQILAANERGAVYSAVQRSLDRYVAVKILSPALGQDEAFMESFVRSNSLVAGLRHPNLITVFDTGIVEGMPYIVMEFVYGKSLHRSMRGRVIELNPSMAIIGEICEGVSHAHERGLIHGNLDPLSILLNQTPSPKIGGFAMSGFVHTVADTEPPEHFKAPEILAGEAATPASDVYAIAALFSELITGYAFTPDAPAASTMVPVPRAIDRVIQLATASDPGQRTADALQFFKQLQQAAVGPKKVSLAATQPPRVLAPSAAIGKRSAPKPLLKARS